MRSYLRSYILPTVAALILFCAPATAQTRIVVQTWGGAFTDAMNDVKPDIEKATNTKIELVTQPTAVAGFQRLEAQRANPQVDIWMASEGTAAVGLAKGIVDPVTAAEAPNLQSLPASLVFPAGPTIWLSPRGIFYRVDKTPFEIKTWEDLWDPRLKGMITTSIDEDRGIFLMIAALLAGGSEKNIDPGFEKLKSLKPNIGVIYKSDADSLKFIQSGEVSVAGYGLLGVIYKHLGPGSPYKFVVPPKPQYMSVNLVTLIKGRPNRDAAVKVLNALLAPDIQERLVEYIGSLPSNQNAKPPSRIRDLIPPLGDLFRPDWDYVNAQFPQWVERWNREIATR